MKEPHIYFDGEKRELGCSLCGDSETVVGDNGFKRFKLTPIHNKNIVRPSAKNPDMKWYAECPTCRKQTQIHLGPYLYY